MEARKPCKLKIITITTAFKRRFNLIQQKLVCRSDCSRLSNQCSAEHALLVASERTDCVLASGPEVILVTFAYGKRLVEIADESKTVGETRVRSSD